MNAPYVVAASGHQLVRTTAPWHAYGPLSGLMPSLNTPQRLQLAHDARIRPDVPGEGRVSRAVNGPLATVNGGQ